MRMHVFLLLLGLVATTQAFFLPSSVRLASPTTRLLPPLQPHVPRRRSPIVCQSTAAPPAQDANLETVLWLRGLSNTFDGNRYQFKDISLSIGKGQKIGLVGVNGCGKSTLLKCIGRVLKAESGEIETLKGLQVVYVDQEPQFAEGLKVKDVMFSPTGSPAMAAVWAYQKASEGLASGTEEAYDKFNEASNQMDISGGWEAETIANQIYTQLNVIDLQDKLCSTLSGGQRKRLGLATALVRKV